MSLLSLKMSLVLTVYGGQGSKEKRSSLAIVTTHTKTIHDIFTVPCTIQFNETFISILTIGTDIIKPALI